MPRKNKSWPDRFITAVKIAAILFLFSFLCFAAPSRDTAARQAAGAKVKAAKTAPDTIPAKAAVKKKPDTVSAKIATGAADTVMRPRAASISDTAKLAASAKKDTVPIVKAQAETLQDSTAKITASGIKTGEKKIPASIPDKKWTSITKPAALIIFLAVVVFAAIVIGIANIVAQKRQKRRFLTTTRLSVMDKEVQKACRYIEKNYSNPELTVQSICAALVTGEAFLEALMQRDLGISIGDFITHVRINRAKGLAQNNPSCLRESAAQQTGFIDTDAFDAEFKKITGVPFEEYCRVLREKT
ncbi:MAG TPA: helix-turn-helix domain-containing protein [Chitinivibrionales bacterium]|nr:helix-turn-helix domain-containing protein [Chitinivibrionales bacterium]